MRMRRVDVEDDDDSEAALLRHSSTGRKGEEKTNHGHVDFEGLKKHVLVAAVEVRGHLPRVGGGLGFAGLHPCMMNRPPCRASPVMAVVVGPS